MGAEVTLVYRCGPIGLYVGTIEALAHCVVHMSLFECPSSVEE